MPYFTQPQYNAIESVIKSVNSYERVSNQQIHALRELNVLDGFTKNANFENAKDDVYNVIDTYDQSVGEDELSLDAQLTETDINEVANHILMEYDYSEMNEDIYDELTSRIEARKD